MALGMLLKSGSSLIRALELLLCLFVLGTFSFYIGVIRHNGFKVATWNQAVEGIAAAAVIYTFFAVFLTFFLAGKSAFIGIILDLCFCGAFIAVAILTRDGSRSCSGTVTTPFGIGKDSDLGVGGYHLDRICKLEKAIFAIAIALAILFLISALMQLLLGMHHKRENRYGPSPANDYTSGQRKGPFWKRQKAGTMDAEAAGLGAVGTGAVVAEKHHHHNNNTTTIRPSNDTGMTGSTMATHEPGYGVAHKKHAEPTVPIIYDPAPAAPVHRPGYPHIEPAGGHNHTHMPVAAGANDGYAADGYGTAPRGHTNF